MRFATHRGVVNADFCSQCGTSLPSSAQFCPKCGKPVPVVAPPPPPPLADTQVMPPPAAAAPPPPAAAPAPPPVTAAPPPAGRSLPGGRAAGTPYEPLAAAPAHGRSALWWILPLALLVIGGVVFLLLSGAPYGRDEGVKVAPAPETETIAEGEAGASATLVEPGDAPPTATGLTGTAPPILREEPPASVIGEPNTTTPPPRTAEEAPPAPAPQPRVAATPPPRVATTPPPRVATNPPPRVVTTPPPAAAPPRETPRETPPRQAQPSGEISRDEAVNVLRGFVTGRDYYGIGTTCTSIRGGTYRNVGYTLEVHDSCTNRLLGLWRVDSKTREIFRQQSDGRFLRP